MIGLLSTSWAVELLNLQLNNPATSKPARALVCLGGAPNTTSKLLVFAHGGGLYADDYRYLCEQNNATTPPRSVALLVSSCDDPPCPVDGLEPMARDLAFLASALPLQSASNHSSPLYGRLLPDSTVAGHSMGAAAALLAADARWSGAGKEFRWCGLSIWVHEGCAGFRRVVALAPGLYPEQKVCVACHLKNISVPVMLVVGDEDCVPESRLDNMTLPIFSHLRTSMRAIVGIRGGNHCQWSTPVRGSCPWDICGSLARERQQQIGLELVQALELATASTAGSYKLGWPSATGWSAFESFLCEGSMNRTWSFATRNTTKGNLVDRCGNCSNMSVASPQIVQL